MTEEKIRAFIAIDLPKAITEQLYKIALELEQKIDGLRPTQPQNIHLTLKFLGHIPKSSAEKLKKSLNETAKDFKNFDITLEEIGVFPNLKYPRVLWIAPKEGCEEVKKIKENLDNQLSVLGVEKDEKEFKAHITFGRFKGKKVSVDLKEFLAKIKIDSKNIFNINAIHLYQSTLSRKGPIYTKLYSAKL